MWSQKQQQNVRTSAPSLWRVILPFVGGGVMIATIPFLFGSPFVMLFGMLILLGAGGGLWWLAYEAFHRWHTYDTSYLRLETTPVSLGTTLRARLQVSVSADDQPPNGFQVRVAATQGSGDDETTVWEDWTSVRGQPGVAETEVPITFDLPAQPLWTFAEKKKLERLDWTMEVAASFDDTDSRIGQPDYEASFDLPVAVPDDLERQS